MERGVQRDYIPSTTMPETFLAFVQGKRILKLSRMQRSCIRAIRAIRMIALSFAYRKKGT